MNSIKTLHKWLFGTKWGYAVIALASCLLGSLVVFVAVVPSVPAQSAELRLPELSPAGAGQRVLFFSPHPDDETIAAGGYLAMSAANGANIKIVLVTDGNKNHDKATRYAEFQNATAILGIPASNLVFLGFPDGKLASLNMTRLQLSLLDEIESYHPDVVIYPSPNDHHPDHAAIGRAMRSILGDSRSGIKRYEYLVHYELIYPRPYSWKFRPGLYLLPPTRLAGNATWVKLTLSDNVEAQKKQALLCYSSQFHSVELNGLLHSFVRRNELFDIPPAK